MYPKSSDLRPKMHHLSYIGVGPVGYRARSLPIADIRPCHRLAGPRVVAMHLIHAAGHARLPRLVSKRAAILAHG